MHGVQFGRDIMLCVDGFMGGAELGLKLGGLITNVVDGGLEFGYGGVNAGGFFFEAEAF